MDATVNVSDSGKETQESISDTIICRNSLQIEPQKRRNAKYHIYFTLLVYQVPQNESPTLCRGQPLAHVLLKDLAYFRRFGYV